MNTVLAYRTVLDEAALAELVAELQGCERFGFDVETTSVRPMECDLVGLSFATNEQVGWYVPVGHYDPLIIQTRWGTTNRQPSLFEDVEPVIDYSQLPLHRVIEVIRPIMQDPEIGKIAHNAPYDGTVMLKYGVPIRGWEADTYAAAWYLRTIQRRGLDLATLVRTRFGYDMQEIETLIGPRKRGGRKVKQRSFAEVAIEDAVPYAADDAIWTLALWNALKPELEQIDIMEPLWRLDMKLIEVVCHMQFNGISVDTGFAEEYRDELDAELDRLKGEMREITGHEVPVNSNHWVSNYLFRDRKLPTRVTTKTKSGHYSVDAKALQKLVELDDTGFVDKVLQYREVSKLSSTYIPPLMSDRVRENGRIFPNHSMLGASSGRFASSNPNVQNIPIRSEKGKQIRKAYRAEPGKWLLAADYSQVELRVLAHMSRDQWMIDAFNRGLDIHRLTAADIFAVPFENVTDDHRRMAKAVNFGLAYGAGPWSLVFSTGCTIDEAKRFRKKFFERAPGVKWYMETVWQLVQQRGFVKTLYGRRSYTNHYTAAINHPIQGTAADIIRTAMVNIFPYLPQYQAKLILQIHDELVFELPEDQIGLFKPIVREVMVKAVTLKVPLAVDMSVGKNLYELKG